MAKRPMPLLWTLLIICSSVLVVTISGILYTNYVARENNKQWCDVLVTIDDAYEQVRSNPNATSAGKNIGEKFHNLRVRFQC